MQRVAGYPDEYLRQEAPLSQPVSISKDLACSCPMLCADIQGSLTPLPIEQLKVHVDIHVSMAFVELDLLSSMPASWQASEHLVLFLPKAYNSTVTNLAVHESKSGQVFATALVPAKEAEGRKWRSSAPGPQQQLQGPLASVDFDHPELLALPLGTCPAGSQFRARATIVTPMTFHAGRYVLRLPTTLPSACVPSGTPLAQVLDLQVSISSGVQGPVSTELPSHPHSVAASGPGHTQLVVSKDKPLKNCDLQLSYQVWSNDVVTSLSLQLPAPGAADPRGTFCLSLAPPAPDRTAAFHRRVVFIIDRSGSMTGQPMEAALEALLTGLRLLRPEDTFNIVAFDHEQMWYGNALMPATPENTYAAADWVRHAVSARGLTDILTPLQQAIQQLEPPRGGPEAAAAANGLPCIFLLTDGAVSNERQICSFAASTLGRVLPGGGLAPRLATFGIGRHCNHFFLQQLAVQGRGSFDVAFRPENIRPGMERLLLAAAAPVLTELTLHVGGEVKDLELYPNPLPDLFCGQPLLVVGRYSGSWPDRVTLSGLLPSGQSWQQEVAARVTEATLDRVFARQQLDLMTAQAWARQDQRLEQQVVDLSMATGVASAHTRLVGFPTSQENYQRLQRHQRKGKKTDVTAYALGGAAAVVLVAGAAVLFTFGDVVATAGNIAGFVGADVLGGAAAGGCCDGGCGDCVGGTTECCWVTLVAMAECCCSCIS